MIFPLFVKNMFRFLPNQMTFTMKKYALLTLITLAGFLVSCNNPDAFPEFEDPQNCDGGTFTGVARLRTQAEVDAFGANCYRQIDGGLIIGPNEGASDDITNLEALFSIEQIYASDPAVGQGKLNIINTNNLTNLEGLDNLVQVAGLLVSNNQEIINLGGLESLITCTNEGAFNDVIVSNNPKIASLIGLNNLTQVGTDNSGIPTAVTIQANPLLTTLSGFDNLLTVYGTVTIGSFQEASTPELGNASLTNLCSLSNLISNGVYTSANIYNNAYNPTVQDIIDGNCSQ